jgi:uncharacterized protein (TIGR02246 family)
MEPSELEARLRALEDTEEIRDLARRYAHCVWRGDAAGAAALFAEDGEMRTGFGDPLVGRGAIRASYEQAFAASRFLPFVHDHRVELAGDRASGRCHLDLRATAGGEIRIGAGWYDDRYERGDGRWLFRSRRLELAWLVPLAPAPAEGQAPLTR